MTKAEKILRDELLKVAGWLNRLAFCADEKAKDTRFQSLAEANAADAKNYRATRDHIMAAIAKAEACK